MTNADPEEGRPVGPMTRRMRDAWDGAKEGAKEGLVTGSQKGVRAAVLGAFGGALHGGVQGARHDRSVSEGHRADEEPNPPSLPQRVNPKPSE